MTRIARTLTILTVSLLMTTGMTLAAAAAAA